MTVRPDLWDVDYTVVVRIDHAWGGTLTVSELARATLLRKEPTSSADGELLSFVLSAPEPSPPTVVSWLESGQAVHATAALNAHLPTSQSAHAAAPKSPLYLPCAQAAQFVPGPV